MFARFIALILLIMAGLIIAIPMRRVVDNLLSSTVGFANFSSFELAMIGLFPVLFLFFRVFIGPIRKFLSGRDPLEDERDKRR